MTGNGNKRTCRFWAFVLALSLLALSGGLSTKVFAQEAPPAPPPSTHVVRPGDTLWDLSRQYLNSPIRWYEIQRDNSITVPERLHPGQVLTLGSSAAVIDVFGEVALTRAQAPPRTVSVASSLEAGDVLVTGNAGFVAVELSDGARIVVPSNTAVKLVAVQGQATRLELIGGRLEAYVMKRKDRDFEIRTRTFALGVRGTHFRARSDSEASTLEVLEGTVVAKQLADERDSVLLVAGQGVSLAPGSELRARALLPPPRQMVTNELNLISAERVPGAISYQLQLARDPDFIRLSAEIHATAPDFRLPSHLAPGFYHARLSAFDAQRIEGEPRSDIVFVPTGAIPDQNTVRRLADGTYEIRWTSRQSTRHTFELADLSDFSDLIVRESGNFALGVRIGQLDAPGTYFWRCREGDEEAVPQTVWGGTFEVPIH